MKTFIRKINNPEVIVLIAIAFAWSWLFQIDIEGLASNYLVGAVIVLVTYIFTVTVSWFSARFMWRYFRPEPRKNSIFKILRLIAIWSAIELLIAWVVNLLVVGHGASWDNALPFTSLTPLVMITPLKFLTRFFGYFGTSAIVGVGILLLYRRQWRTGLFYWSAVSLLTLSAWGLYRTPSGVDLTATIVSEYTDQKQPVNLSETDFLLLPEYGIGEFEPNGGDRLSDNERQVSFSGSKEVYTDKGKANVLVYGDTKNGITAQHTKSRLIAFGEYMPFSTELYLRNIHPDIYAEFTEKRGIIKGEPIYEPYFIDNQIVIGNAACSSVGNPGDYRKLTQNGATFLANSASLSLFNESGVFKYFHDGFSSFAAVANARPFLQSSIGWPAFALDQNGNEIISIDPVNNSNVSVTTNTKITPYTEIGEWLVVLGFVAMGVGIFRDLLIRINKPKVKTTKKSRKH